MEVILREAVGWMSVLVSLAGVGVCAAQLGRVRRAGLLMAGFGLQALVSGFYRLFTLFTTLLASRGAASGLGAGLAVVSLVSVLGGVAVVAGVAGLLADLRRAGPAA